MVTRSTVLDVPQDAPAGRAKVLVEVMDADGELWRTKSGEGAVHVARLIVVDSERRAALAP
jgi:hypothetical protein